LKSDDADVVAQFFLYTVNVQSECTRGLTLIFFSSFFPLTFCQVAAQRERGRERMRVNGLAVVEEKEGEEDEEKREKKDNSNAPVGAVV
jgi:hypothetical protein